MLQSIPSRNGRNRQVSDKFPNAFFGHISEIVKSKKEKSKMELQTEHAIEKVIVKLQEERALLPAVRAALGQFASDLSKIEQVHSVFVFASGKIIEFRIFLNSDDYDGEEDVFDAEERLRDNFDGLLFDFHITAKGNRPLENFLSPDLIEIYRKVEKERQHANGN